MMIVPGSNISDFAQRRQAAQTDWLRDPRNLPMVLMAAAIMKKQQQSGAQLTNGAVNRSP